MSKREEKAIAERSEAELTIDPDEAVKEILNLATYLGAQEQWSGSEMLEGIAVGINRVLRQADLPVCDGSDPGELKFWRRQADLLGYEHDGE